MLKEYERLGREHGITHTEIWHQAFADHEIVVQMVEGHDLDTALAEIDRGDQGLDGQLTALTRSMLTEGHAIRDDTELLVDWRV